MSHTHQTRLTRRPTWVTTLQVAAAALRTTSAAPSARPRTGWFAAGLALLLAAHSAQAQQWTRFRGPNGSGVSPAQSVPARWTEADYNWKAQLPGVGHSSPVLWGRKIFLTSGDDETGRRYVLCLDAADGRRLWMREFDVAPSPKHQLNSLASATPAVDSQRVYVCWSTPEQFTVTALDHEGCQVWQRDLGPFAAGYGCGASPIEHQGLVIVPLEHDGEGFLAALDAASGNDRWRVARDSQTAYSTPCVYRAKGRSPELIFTNWQYGIAAIDPEAGHIRWELDVFDKGHVEAAIGSPIVAGELVLGVCGWLGVRQEVIAVRPGAGDQKPRKEYCIDRSAPLVTTPLVKDDLLFLWSDEGVVTCADVGSGRTIWRRRVGGTYYGSPVCAGERLYGTSAEGEVVVLAAAKEYQLLARNSLGEASHSTPAIADGTMYLRTFTHLISIGGER